jgi:DNA polymerase III sliding clamp (beta) subunit (PCNA family)
MSKNHLTSKIGLVKICTNQIEGSFNLSHKIQYEKHNEKVRVNRYIVKSLADAIYYLGQENFLLEDIWKTHNLLIEKIN